MERTKLDGVIARAKVGCPAPKIRIFPDVTPSWQLHEWCYLFGVLSPLQQIRRKVAMILLCVGAGMAIWGTVVLEKHLHGPLGMVYWIICGIAGFVGAALALREAIYSYFLMRTKSRLSHQSLEHGLKRLQANPASERTQKWPMPNPETAPDWLKNN